MAVAGLRRPCPAPCRSSLLYSWLVRPSRCRLIEIFPQTAFLTVIISVLFGLFIEQRLHAEADTERARVASVPEAGAPATAVPDFFRRMPPALGRDLLALEMEDHYLRIHTALGSDLILLRLRDALAELGPARGRQVHRSWWVAEGAIASVERNGGRPVLVLRNRAARAGQQDLSRAGQSGGLVRLTPIRIGILGAGAMGTAHAAAYAGIAEATVVGVFSRDPTRARSAASLCKAEPFSDANALIASADAIDVCLPSATHHAFVVPALKAGKHVFCETPLALDLDEARQMRDAARRADRLLQVGLLMRSLGAYGHIKAVDDFGRARTPAECRDLAAGVLSPPACARSQGALRRSLHRADDLRLRFHPMADGPARPSVGQRGAQP